MVLSSGADVLLRLEETHKDVVPERVAVGMMFGSWSVVCLPHLAAQSFELALELLVGLLLLVQVPLQLLLAVFQSVDLLLSLIHLSL